MSNSDKEEKFDKLWEANEKLAKEISMLEDEYAFVLEQSQLYALQNLAKETEDAIARGEEDELSDEVLDMAKQFSETMKDEFIGERSTLKDQATEMNNALQTRYTAQEGVISEILKMHQEEKETFSTALDNKNINFEMFPDYLRVVGELKVSHNDSTKRLMEMFDKEPA